MRNLILRYSIAILALFGVVGYGWGQEVLVAWETNGLSGITADGWESTTTSANIHTSQLFRGSGINASSSTNGFASNHWTETVFSSAVTANDYIQFAISVKVEYEVSLSTLDINLRRTSTGPTFYQWQYSLDGFATTSNNIGNSFVYDGTQSSGLAQTQIDLSVLSNLQYLENDKVVTFRLYAWGASSTAGSLAVGMLSGDDIVVKGTTVFIGTSPIVFVSPSALTDFNYSYGNGPSSEQLFKVRGKNLLGNITTESPLNKYEISKTLEGVYSDQIELNQSDGIVNETIIYVRLKEGLENDVYTEDMVFTSIDATPRSINLAGMVIEPPKAFSEMGFLENFAEFTGTGFSPNPLAGQLHSGNWRVLGMSDGNGEFFGTHIVGDFTRGIHNGGTGIGGVWAFNVGEGKKILGVQPGGTDFTPGSFTLRLENTSGTTINSIDIDYDIYVYNDQGYSSTLNLSYSFDDISYTPILDADFATPESADITPSWVKTERSVAIFGFDFSPSEFLYIKWSSDDVSGSGSRDEFGITNISITEGSPVYKLYYNVVEISGSNNGSLSAQLNTETISSGDYIPSGSDIVFTASPDEGYKVKGWKINNELQAGHTGTEFTLPNISQNSTVTVEFEPILVTTINVSATDGATEVPYLATLQMLAQVLPTDAKDKSVEWSVVNGTGEASVDIDGLLTGQKLGTVTVKATANDGSEMVGAKEITVIKATPTITTWPVAANPITYGQTLADAGIDDADTEVNVAGTFAYTNPSATPNAGTASFSFTFTPSDTENYNTVTTSTEDFVQVVVDKKILEVTAVVAGDIIYGDPVPTVTPSYNGFVLGDNESNLDNDGFALNTTYTQFDEVKEYSTTIATGTAIDNNYTFDLKTSAFNVNKANPIVNYWPTAGAITYGQAISEASLSGQDIVGVQSEVLTGTYAFNTPNVIPSVGSTDKYSLTFTPTSGNYNPVTTEEVDFLSVSVEKFTATITISNKIQTYDGSPKPVSVSITPENDLVTDELLTWDYSIFYVGIDGTDYEFSSVAPINAGKYDVTVTINMDNYQGAKTEQLEINEKITPQITWPIAANSITYGATVADAGLSGGTAVDPDDGEIVIEGFFAFDNPTYVPEVSSYVAEVTFTPTNTAEYNSVQATVTITVNKRILTIGGSFTANEKIYDGTLNASGDVSGLVLDNIFSTDDVTLANVVLQFTDPNATDYIDVNLFSANLAGSKASNYTLTLNGAPTAQASITPLELAIGGTFTAHSKEYNGNTSAAMNENNLTLVTPIGEDQVALQGIVLEFNTPDVGSNKMVSIVSAELDGDDKSNYTLSIDGAPTATASITAPASTEAQMLTFSFPQQTKVATIGDSTIAIEVAHGTPLTSLVASFTLSAGASATVGDLAQVSGVTPNDFSLPVTYTVTAEDGITTKEWVVTVTVQELLITLDEATKWTLDGTATSYANHAYSDMGVTIQGTNVTRNGTALQDGFPGALGVYSMRLRNATGSKALITVPSGGVGSFALKVRRWTTTPLPIYTVRYSTNEGLSWVSLPNIDGTLLTTSDWHTYSAQLNRAQSNIQIEIANTGTTERVMIDGFSWEGFEDTHAPIATFTPINGSTTVSPSIVPTISFNEPIRNIGGSEINSDNVASLISFKDKDDADVPFTASISDDKMLITINPIAELSTLTQYTITLAPIEDDFSNASELLQSTFTTASAEYSVTFSVIEVEGSTNGTLTALVHGSAITSGDKVGEGADILFTATPNLGFRVKEWVFNDAPLSENGNTYTLENLNAEANVAVEFEPVPKQTLTLNVHMASESDFNPNTDKVYVLGNFGGYYVELMEMDVNPTKGDDWFSINLELPKGDYSYKYYVNNINGAEFENASRVVAINETPVNVNDLWAGLDTGASINPLAAEFDLSNPSNISTTVYWYAASAVVGVGNNGAPLADTDYSLSDSQLVISGGYIEGLSLATDDIITLSVAFNSGSNATLTITAVSTGITNATINPTSATFNLLEPDDVSTLIIWNDAQSISSITVNGEVVGNDFYIITPSSPDNGTATLTILQSYFDDFAQGDVVFSINFDAGAPNLFKVVVASIEPPKYLITFTVTHGDTPIENASIAIDGIETQLSTNASGVATIELLNGDYNFTVLANGYLKYSSDFTVSDSPLSFPVNLTIDPVHAILAWDTQDILDPKQDALEVYFHNENLVKTSLTRGSGLLTGGTTSANTFHATGWFTEGGTEDDAIVSNKYFQIRVEPQAGYGICLSSLSFNFRRSAAGPNGIRWHYSLDGVTFTPIGEAIAYETTPINGLAFGPIDLSKVEALQNLPNLPLILRLYGWGATASTGSGSIGRLSGDDIVVMGEVIALPDTDAPVATFFPSNGASEVPVDVKPTISFDEPVFISHGFAVDNSNISDIIALVSDKQNVACAITFTNNIATLTPVEPLSEGATYTLSVSPVQDRWGNRMANPASAIFTTVPPVESNTYPVSFSVVKVDNEANGALTATANGQAISSGANVEEGFKLEFTASPNQGYRVREWTLNGNPVASNSSNSLEIASLSEAVTVTVEFEPEPVVPTLFTLTFGVVEVDGELNGTLITEVNGNSISTGHEVEEGSSVVFTASPAPGYRLKAWYLNGNILVNKSDLTYTLSGINDDVEVTVEFESVDAPTTYPVIFSVIEVDGQPNGQISATANGQLISTGSWIEGGASLAFTASPNEGYELDAWIFNGQEDTSLSQHTVTYASLDMALDIRVRFRPVVVEYFDLTYGIVESNGLANGLLAATVNGVPVESGQQLAEGVEVQFTASPLEGFRVKDWTVNGNVQEASVINTLTISSLAQDTHVTVEFTVDEPSTYLVEYQVITPAGGISGGSLTATANGSPISSGDRIAEGADLEFVATPSEGKMVKMWVLNGTILEGNTSTDLKVKEVSQNISVDVSFDPISGVNSQTVAAPKAYPNPFDNDLIIDNATEYKRVFFSRIDGTLVRVVPVGTNGRINTSSLTDGLYVVTFESIRGDRFVTKMVKQR